MTNGRYDSLNTGYEPGAIVVQPQRFLVMLMLLVTPLGARAQQLAPASLDEPCSVPPDPRWTPQEKFVWERVCSGKSADFSAAPGYGGELDPKKPDGWPQNRVLRPAFLETILFKDPYRRALARAGVVIRGARFTEALELDDAELEHPFGLQLSLFEKGVSLRRVKSKFPIGFEGSKVAGSVDMYELELGGDLGMQNGGVADVNLRSAHVSQLDLSDSEVSGPLDMVLLHVDKVLFMGGSKVSGELNMNGVQVGASLSMNCKAEFAEWSLPAPAWGASSA